MLALTSVFVAVILSLLITRVATVALALTGLSRESARFQARSALSGAGFTTSESEAVVNHPVRRRIVMFLMLVGSAGIVTVVGTVVLSFANADSEQRATRLAALLGGLVLVWLVARSRRVDRWMSKAIARVLDRWTSLDARDYAELLHLSETYAVIEIGVRAGDWVAGRTLRAAAPARRGRRDPRDHARGRDVRRRAALRHRDRRRRHDPRLRALPAAVRARRPFRRARRATPRTRPR